MSKEHQDIMEVKHYVDAGGREIHQFVQTFGKKMDPAFYKGRAMIRVQPMNANGAPMPIQTLPFEFLFPKNTTLKSAFETFDEIAKKEVDEHARKMKEQAANKVVPAKSMPPILGLDGKPV